MENTKLPGHALPIDFDYSIQVKTWNPINATAITVRALTMLPDGTIQKHTFNHNPVSVTNNFTTRHKIDSGWLLAVSAHSDIGGILPGQYFVEVALVRGETASPGASMTLIAGYLNRAMAISWPTTPVKSINDMVPETIFYTVTNPAVGTDLAYDGAARVTLVPQAINFTLTTSAGVANRRMILQLGAEGTDFAEIIAQTVQTASLAWKYYFNLNAQLDQLTGLKYTLRMPMITLDSLVTIYTAIENIQVGDQISSVRMLLGTRLQGVS